MKIMGFSCNLSLQLIHWFKYSNYSEAPWLRGFGEAPRALYASPVDSTGKFYITCERINENLRD